MPISRPRGRRIVCTLPENVCICETIYYVICRTFWAPLVGQRLEWMEFVGITVFESPKVSGKRPLRRIFHRKQRRDFRMRWKSQKQFGKDSEIDAWYIFMNFMWIFCDFYLMIVISTVIHCIYPAVHVVGLGWFLPISFTPGCICVGRSADQAVDGEVLLVQQGTSPSIDGGLMITKSRWPATCAGHLCHDRDEHGPTWCCFFRIPVVHRGANLLPNVAFNQWGVGRFKPETLDVVCVDCHTSWKVELCARQYANRP